MRCDRWSLRPKRETTVTTIANDTPTGEVDTFDPTEAAEINAEARAEVEAELAGVDEQAVEAVDDATDAVADVADEAAATTAIPADLFAAAGAASAAATVAADVLPEASPVDVATAEAAQADKPRKRVNRGLLWGSVGAGVLLVGAGAASLVLLAPNTTIAGVPVGWQMPGQAASAVEQQIQNVIVQVKTPSGSFEISGAELGATIDAAAIADEAHAGSPLWNFGTWSGKNYSAPVTLDPAKLEAAAEAAQPESFVAPTDATVTYNAETGKYVLTPGAEGTGIDASAASAAIASALANGETNASFEAVGVPVLPRIADDAATAFAERMNTEITGAGFYIGNELVVPVDGKTISQMVTPVPNAAGDGYDMQVDAAPLQAIIATIPEKVNRAAQNGEQIVDSHGEALEVSTAAVDGRQVGDLSKISDEFVSWLENPSGTAWAEVPATVTPGKMVNIERQIHVDLTNQMLYMMQDGQVVDSWLVSTGRPWQATVTGTHRIEAKLRSQDMRGDYITSSGPVYEADGSIKQYLRTDVQYPMYFYLPESQAFHGVYWHSTWGTPNSAGCVGMPDWRAEQLYNWTPYGTEVVIYGYTPAI